MTAVARRLEPVHYPETDHMGEDALQRFIAELLRPLVAMWLAMCGRRCFVGADQFVYLVQLCEEREKMILWMSDAYGILAATGHGISLRQRADDLLGTDGRPWR